VKDVLHTYLGALAETAGVCSAVLGPESYDPPVWRVLRGSDAEVGKFLRVPLSTSPRPVAWPDQRVALGMQLASRWEPLGVVVWPSTAATTAERLNEVLEACRNLYWEECEQRWMDCLCCLLVALREQRHELGNAIHRGPAQALTAARLELSMLGENPAWGGLKTSLENASEGLVDLVHVKLRGRGKGEALEETVRSEIGFQARWRNLSANGGSVTLPRTPLNETLGRLWRLSGRAVDDRSHDMTFTLTETPQ
jgi:hypothetical protein